MTLTTPSAMPALGSLEHANRRLENIEFLAAGIDRELFQQMKTAIETMMRPGDNIEPLPNVNEPRAWSMTFPVYSKLKQRQEAPPPDLAQRQQAVARQAEYDRTRTRFLAQREALLAERLDSDVREYLGLESDDLADPFFDHEKYGRVLVADWSDRAFRVNQAVLGWARMSAGEKQSIASTMETRRVYARIKKLEQKLQQTEKANA